MPLKNYSRLLYHHGIKGQKWGVRRTPEQLGHKKSRVEKTQKASIIKTTIYGHKSPPKQSTPNGIVDHVSYDGRIKTRAFYDRNGFKEKEIHTIPHSNIKHHNFGNYGELDIL